MPKQVIKPITPCGTESGCRAGKYAQVTARFSSPSVLNAAECVDDVQHVRHALSRMINIALRSSPALGAVQEHLLYVHRVRRALLTSAHIGIALADVYRRGFR